MAFTEFDRYRMETLAPQGLEASATPEEQGGDYESGRAVIVDATGRTETWRVRTAKVTPTKAGAFVAVWRRTAGGGTEPFPSDEVAGANGSASTGTGAPEHVAGLLVFVRDADRRGVFRFTSEHLRGLGVTSSPQRPGKRGFRVYPSWCTDLNRQAQRTQAAQARAFTVLEPSVATDF